MRPCDCRSAEEATQKLNEQGISFNNDSLRVMPGVVLLSLGAVDIKVPMSRFKLFAEWYLEDQRETNEDILSFDRWYRKLLTINVNHGEFGMDHPLGSCCYRDVLRHEKVLDALKSAWKEVMDQEFL